MFQNLSQRDRNMITGIICLFLTGAILLVHNCQHEPEFDPRDENLFDDIELMP